MKDLKTYTMLNVAESEGKSNNAGKQKVAREVAALSNAHLCQGQKSSQSRDANVVKPAMDVQAAHGEGTFAVKLRLSFSPT